VTDCAAARQGLGALAPGAGFPLLAVTYEVEGSPEQGSRTVDDVTGLGELLASACD